jgi:hypothetical protein
MHKPFTRLAVLLLAVIAFLQLLRFVAGWTVTVNAAIIPVWVSGVASVIAGGIAFMTWRELDR